MKKRTLFLAMTALMITMTSGGSLTAVYADEIPTEAAETFCQIVCFKISLQ